MTRQSSIASSACLALGLGGLVTQPAGATTLGSPAVVADLNPGPAGSNPDTFAVAPGRLYFIADPSSGRFFATAEGDGSAASMIPALGAAAPADSLGVLGAALHGGTFASGSEPPRLWVGDATGMNPTDAFVFTPPSRFTPAGGAMYMTSGVGAGAAQIFVGSAPAVHVGSPPCDATPDDAAGGLDLVSLGPTLAYSTGGAGWTPGFHVATGCDATLIDPLSYANLAPPRAPPG